MSLTQVKENVASSCIDEKKNVSERPKRRKSTPVISLTARRVDTQQEAMSMKLKSKPVKRTASSALFDKENVSSKKIKLESIEIVDEHRVLQKEPSFECFECKKVLSTYFSMVRHLKTIHNKTEKDIVKLAKTHMEHVDNLQACEFCAKSFKRENTLLAHVKSFHLNGILNKN